MQLNVAKSCVMWFKPKRAEVTSAVYIDNTLLKEVTAQKYLSVHIDNQLNWTAHVCAICKNLSHYLFRIITHRILFTQRSAVLEGQENSLWKVENIYERRYAKLLWEKLSI